MKAYRSSTPFLRTVTPTGEVIQFVGHRFLTKNPSFIEYLDTFQNIAGSMITVEGEVDDAEANPMDLIKKKAVEEFLQQQEEQAKSQNRGNSTQGPAVITTSEDLPGSAKLENLKKSIKI
jgi:hypothetical protein